MSVSHARTVGLCSSSKTLYGSDIRTYDLVIYGPTSAGIAAAVQAKRMNLDVVVVGPDKHLGGLSAGGLGWTDSGNKAVIGGITLEFLPAHLPPLRPTGCVALANT